MLNKDYSKRLGHKDYVTEIMGHRFFKSINWKDLEKKKVLKYFANIFIDKTQI